MASYEKALNEFDTFNPVRNLWRNVLIVAISDAIKIKAKVLWAQIGVFDEEAAKLAEDAGLKVVMNRCPKIELFRPFWKPKLNLGI